MCNLKMGLLVAFLLVAGNGIVQESVLAAPAASLADTFYVSDFLSNTIVKFTPDGVGSVFAHIGMGGAPAFIAIQAIPEPATLTLLALGGLALLGRRR